MGNRTVVILGGGVGGLVAANELRRLLPDKHRVVLVEKNAQHAFAPSFLWLMVGDRTAEQVTRPVSHLLRCGVEFVHAEVKHIDLHKRRVEVDSQSLVYDYLIVALGAQMDFQAVPGLMDEAHTFYTLTAAARLHSALQTFTGGTIAIVIAGTPYKCPGAPHKGAMLIEHLLRKKGVRGQASVHLFTPEPQPMPVAGPALGDAVKQMLNSRGIGFHTQHKLTSVDITNRRLLFEDRGAINYDLLITIPLHKGPALVREAGLANESGWIPVDRYSLTTTYENVYAIGDVTTVPIPGRWKPGVPLMLPKAGVFAHAQALTVARRIVAEISGTRSALSFCGDGYCMLEAGKDMAGFAYGDFYAEPSPQIRLRQVGRIWHLGKVLFEQWWLAPFGPRRKLLETAIRAGAAIMRIPVSL